MYHADEPMDTSNNENSDTALFGDDDPMIPAYDNDLMEDDSKLILDEKDPTGTTDEGEVVVKRKKGRPKGSFKNGTPAKENRTYRPAKPRLLKVNVEGETNANERIPKMRQNVGSLKLTSEQIDDLKSSGRNFYQPGVCFIIAPQLDKCIECLKKNKKRRQYREVDCRFYQFRKLKYINDKLVVAGFLDASDPKEIDRSIWIPQPDKFRFKSLSVAYARLIISHVGDELCKIFAKERSYCEKYKSPEKPLIWKRLIDGVLELCDLCNTTLFNFHLICTSCGLTLCIECANEQNPSLANKKCSIKDKEEHNYDELCLTQIIVGDSMDIIQRTLHDVVKRWNIHHECTYQTESILEFDKAKDNIINEVTNDDGVGKTFLHRELPHLFKCMDVDLSTIKFDDEEPPPIINEISLSKKPQKPKYIRPARYFTKAGKETVISVSRVMSQATSNLFYKDVPHKWMCENKLLRLMDPVHPRNEEFFTEQWQRGQPVIISNVLEHLDKKLWLPQSFSNEFGKEKSDFINCMTGNLVRNKDIAVFWDGFEVVEKRLRDNDGKPMLLKVKFCFI